MAQLTLLGVEVDPITIQELNQRLRLRYLMGSGRLSHITTCTVYTCTTGIAVCEIFTPGLR